MYCWRHAGGGGAPAGAGKQKQPLPAEWFAETCAELQDAFGLSDEEEEEEVSWIP